MISFVSRTWAWKLPEGWRSARHHRSPPAQGCPAPPRNGPPPSARRPDPSRGPPHLGLREMAPLQRRDPFLDLPLLRYAQPQPLVRVCMVRIQRQGPTAVLLGLGIPSLEVADKSEQIEGTNVIRIELERFVEQCGCFVELLFLRRRGSPLDQAIRWMPCQPCFSHTTARRGQSDANLASVTTQPRSTTCYDAERPSDSLHDVLRHCTATCLARGLASPKPSTSSSSSWRWSRSVESRLQSRCVRPIPSSSSGWRGGIVDHVRRVLDDQPLYQAPSITFTPTFTRRCTTWSVLRLVKSWALVSSVPVWSRQSLQLPRCC